MIPTAFAPLVTHLWQSTVFAAVAGLLTLALRRNQARVRYWLWLAASYKFLIPFSWLVSIGHQFEWRTAPAIVPSIMPLGFSAVTDAVSGPAFLTALPAAKPTPDHLPALLVAIWACGFVVVAYGWVREWIRIRAMVRGASPLRFDLPFDSRPKEGEILRCAQNDNEKQKVLRVVSTDARLEPGVFGIFRPVLLLPEGIADRLTQAQLQAIIAHELCHVRRRDNLTAAVHMLVEALFWFHPLVWWMGVRLIDERERACDEEVLRAGSHAQIYAESILKVCEFYSESPLSCVSGVTGSDLKKRLQRIMKKHFGAGLSAWKKLLLVSAAVMALTVPLIAGVLTAPRLRAQAPTSQSPTIQAGAADTPKFDVASIKQCKPGDFPTINRGGKTVRSSPGRLTVECWSVASLIRWAYLGFPDGKPWPVSAASPTPMPPPSFMLVMDQPIKGSPGWLNSERYTIEAVAGNPQSEEMMRGPMMQALLESRFNLKIHREAKETIPIYALTVAKGGPKLQASHEGGCVPFDADNPPKVLAGHPPCGLVRKSDVSDGVDIKGVSMTDLCGELSAWLGREVTDKTGIEGVFDIHLDVSQAELGHRDPGPSDPAVAATQPESDPSAIITAVRELGLKLEATKGPGDFLVIDSVERPSPN